MKRASLATLVLVAASACDPQEYSWGFSAIELLKTPPDDPSLGCGVNLPADPGAAARDACSFTRGATAKDTLGISPSVAATIPIRHVVIMMRENRSFDQLLGNLHERGQPGTEPIPPTFTNPDLSGAMVGFRRETNTCIAFDPPHQSAGIQAGVNGGKLDGFVKNAAEGTGTDGHWALSTYDSTELPFYYFLASTFALNDRHFAAVASGTYANRSYFLMGQNVGVVDTGIVFPSANTPTLMHLIMNKRLTWGAYTDTLPFSGTLNMTTKSPGVHSLQAFYDALDQGTLPNVSFVDGEDSVDDDHPPGDLQRGEAWAKTLYDHAIKSPQWERLVIFYTYDEAGGFGDHVPPPQGCRATPESPFVDRGPRVPFVAISPWAKRNYVSHVPQDHTAITRFIETVFDLPAMTARDANAPALLDLFDFRCGRDLSVPMAPAPGTGGCTKAK